MGRRIVIATILMILIAEATDTFGQPQRIPVTDTMRDACKSGGFSSTDCESLVQVFYSDKTASGVLLESFHDPFAHLGPFIAAERKESFVRAASGALRKDLTNELQDAQNAAAQMISTKAAVNQTGASPGSSGSTNLVTKPTTSSLISLAAESGAFTDTVNGNTLTAQANADGLRRYISGDPFSPLIAPVQDTLNHINLTATFSVAQNGSSGVPTSGSATLSTPTVANIVLPSNDVSFDSLSVNYSLRRPYNPRSKTFIASWQAALAADQSALDTAMKILDNAVVNGTKIRVAANSDANVISARMTWLAQAKADEENADFSQFVKDYAEFCKVYVTALRAADPANFDADILTINSALEGLGTAGEKVLDDARGKPLITMVYTYSTPQNKPATHQATFAGAYVWKGSGTQLTGNAAGTWFASVPAGAKYGQVQSYQFSGELDQPIGPKIAPRAIFSLAGYGQYQYSPTVLNITSGNLAPGTNITLPGNAQVLLGTAGWLGVAQTKLVFNIGKGASIPVAVKWSNKTDLLQGSDWKGQFGFSYDLSALQSMLLPKK